MNMRNIYIKWKPKLKIIYENKLIDEPVNLIHKKFQNTKFQNTKYQNTKFQNKKMEINDLAVECFEF